MSVTGSADGPPQRAGVAMFDVLTGLHAAVAVLGALHERDASGKGQHIHLDLLSSALSSLVNQTTGYVACGNDPQRMGNDHPSLFPYGPFPTADKDLIITVGNNPQFRRLVTVLGLPELGEDPRFDTVEKRTTTGTSCARCSTRRSPRTPPRHGPPGCRPRASRAPPSSASPRAWSTPLPWAWSPWSRWARARRPCP